MKKLNSKGFTLIELLAIIVILAIIMVVTIPTVLNSMDTAKRRQFENTANIVADWLQKQVETYYMFGESGSGISDGVSELFVDFLENAGSYEADQLVPLGYDILEAAGVANAEENIHFAGALMIDDKVCVVLEARKGGSFYVTPENDDDPINFVYNSSCPNEE